MNVEYHKWFSSNLNRDMEFKVYGYYGKPVVVFPAQGGRFYEFEDFGMIEVLNSFIEGGQIKVFTPDSVDRESWANWNAHPADRARRHQEYDAYICGELVPFIRQHCGGTPQKFLSTGVSMGGYHSANFFFRHPDIFDALVSMSGLHKLTHFVGDYMDENVYYNAPLAYLPDLCDPWYLDQYRQSKIVIVCGQGAWEDEMLRDVLAMRNVLEGKGIPAWIDLWGFDVNHDWPWWKKMLPYYLSKILQEEDTAVN